MLPHPTTMEFAWEEDVLRCSRVLVGVFVLAVIALIGAPVLINRGQDVAPVAATERTSLVTTLSNARFSTEPERLVAASAAEARLASDR